MDRNNQLQYLINPFTGKFGVVEPQFGRAYESFHSTEQNGNSAQYSRDQVATKQWVSLGVGVEEGQGGAVSKPSQDDNF